jgi:hypothetical protein
MAATDGWSEWCLVAVSAQGGTDIPFQAITTTVDIDMGDKDLESVEMLDGSRMVKFMPQGDTTVTLEMYPEEAGSGDISAATAGTGVLDLLHAEDTTEPYAIVAVKARSKYRLCILWTDKATATSATEQIITPTNQALRFVAADGYFVSAKPGFTDGLLKWTVKFKVPPLDGTGNENIMMESVAGAATATMTALASYTSTVKW